MALSTQFVKLQIDSTIYCIKDFPEIDPSGNFDQIEVTDLCDSHHETINGLKNYADELTFTANYDETKFGTLSAIGTTQKAVDILLCESSTDTTGKNGKFSMTAAEISVRLVGAGVGDALEMAIVVKPKSDITFASVQ